MNKKIIAFNKKAQFNFTISKRYEAGLMLEGWEVKSLRSGRIQIAESYILLKDGEAFLFGALITPLNSACTHVDCDPRRMRKLLLHKKELNQLIGSVERKGYALVPTLIYWKHGHAKLEIALAVGKKTYDKRQDQKQRDWTRQKNRLLKKQR